MTPGARLAAEIQVLATMLETRGSAAAILETWLRRRRFVGSGDRRAITDTLFQILRQKGRLSRALVQTGLDVDARGLVLAHHALEGDGDPDTWFGDGPHAVPAGGPEQQALASLRTLAPEATLPREACWNLPSWLCQRLEDSLGEGRAGQCARQLATRAPVDLRVNCLRISVAEASRRLRDEGVDCRVLPWAPAGLRVEGHAPVRSTLIYREGLVEFQDAGAQVAVELAAPRGTVIDLCAGGGGKTLALWSHMRGEGRLLATDRNVARMRELRNRIRRARASGIKVVEADPGFDDAFRERADLVLADVPCSGSGAWNRRPWEKWQLTGTALRSLVQLQGDILGRAARLVRPGGRLVYVTCSLFAEENQGSAEAFLGRHPMFQVVEPEQVWKQAMGSGEPAPVEGPGLLLAPVPHGTNGFFVATFARRS